MRDFGHFSAPLTSPDLSKQKTLSALINILLFLSRKKTKTVNDFYFVVKPIAKVFYRKKS